MILSVFVNGDDYSGSVLAEETQIAKDISDRMAIADVTFKVHNVNNLAHYDTALWDVATYGTDIRELYEIRIEDQNGARHFAGTINYIEYERKRENLLYLKCKCLDYTQILDRSNVPEVTFTGLTDRQVIQSLVTAYAPGVTATNINVSSLTVLAEITFKNESVKSCIEKICELSGAEWRVDYYGELRYFLPEDYAAPFGLSSEAAFAEYGILLGTWNESTQTWTTVTGTWDQAGAGVQAFYGIDAFTRYTRDFIRPINKCTVLGGYLPGGVELNVSYQNNASIAEYGPHVHTIVDRDIILGSIASLRAQALVEERAFPEESFSINTKRDGLEVGQLLPVIHTDYQVNGSYIIRSIRIKQLTTTLTDYELELGVKPPTQLRLLKQIAAKSSASTHPPIAAAADGTVTNASMGGLIEAEWIGSVNGENIIGTIAAEVIGSINAGAIAGVISAEHIGGITAGLIQGAIISSQVADGLINRLALFAEPLRDIVNLASDPTLPNSEYPEGSIYRNTGSNIFRKVVAGAWVTVTESEAITGKLSFHSIGTVSANQIIGLIAAANIGSINASSIVGAISAENITEVNGSSIVGSITADHIASVFASSILFQIAHTQIGTVNAATISIGLVQNNQIGSVNAGTITVGTLNAATINVINLNASNITTGTVSANRVTGGILTGVVIQGVTIEATQFSTTSGSGTAVQMGASIDGVLISLGGSSASFSHDRMNIGTIFSINSGTGVISVDGLTGVTQTRTVALSPSGSASLQIRKGLVVAF